jgi:hypothetical protein
MSMRVAEATMNMPMERPHDVTRSPGGSPSARFRDTLVLLFAIGAVVVACGLVTLLVLHPLSVPAIAERALAMLALW